MDTQSPPLFDNGSVFPPDTVLGSQYLDPEFLYDREVDVFHNIFSFLTNDGVISGYKTVLFMFSIFFAAVIFYSAIRLFEIRKKEHAHLRHEIEEYNRRRIEQEKKKAEGDVISENERWRQVLHLLFSTNQNDWKLSIIEADAMLETLLGELGYVGNNLGEKLKTAGEKGFRQLNNAWEAHTVRNRIAHEGSTFELSHYEAKRIIALYEQIFRAFGYI